MYRLKTINTGTGYNSGDADTIKDAFEKVNYNFCVIGESLGIEFDKVYWEELKDTKPAAETINRNFNKLNNE